jgi:pimeloyl-ACP methyl ester carboxylesterase
MTILNSESINQAYFFPQDIRCEGAIDVSVNGVTLRCFHHIPNPELPTLIHFHGNGEGVGHYVGGGYHELLETRVGGINSLFIEYRGYGGSGGNPELASMLDDGQAVLEQLKIDPARAIVYGRSIGSLYAIELAKRCPTLAGLVIDSGIANIRERFLEHPGVREKLAGLDMKEGDSEINRLFDHEAKMGCFEGALRIMHTQNDGLIDVSHAHRLHEWAKTTDKDLLVFDIGNHNTIFHVNQHEMISVLNSLAHSLFPELGRGSEGPELVSVDREMLEVANRAIRGDSEHETPAKKSGMFAAIKRLILGQG